MTLQYQSHGGSEEQSVPTSSRRAAAFARAAPPAGSDVAVDEQADFGYFMPPLDAPQNYLPETGELVGHLDELGNLMVDQTATQDVDSTLAPVLTYWGQFLDHELTARTDRESAITSMQNAHPPQASSVAESQLRNARSPRFDLDSVYGGVPIGPGITADIAAVIAGMRHPTSTNKMRVGTAVEPGPLPDNLDASRDLPRFSQVQASVREAAKRTAQASMTPAEFTKFKKDLPKKAIIGDARNDENLVVAQFHLSFLRFHNKTVDFLKENSTGWLPDFSSAQMLTRLHYQWLIVEGYLKGVCDPAVVQRVVDDRASHFFKFRAEYDARNIGTRIGNALPLEFSVAAFRFGHSMVRGAYDHNKNFGRPGTGFAPIATLDDLFTFTGGGGFRGLPKLPKNWVIDWSRFVKENPPKQTTSGPQRVARRIDTNIAPPLGKMIKEGGEHPDGSELQKLFKHLARRNLRRGYNLRIPTGQALHKYLKQIGAVNSGPIADVSTIFPVGSPMRGFLAGTSTKLHQRTPLWFYVLAEAQAAGGNRLGEMGSWLVAATFVGVLLADPDSALSTGFTPQTSPLRLPNNSKIDTIEKWMKFAGVLA